MMLAPCGHGACETCITSWNRANRSASHNCPECRQLITNSTRNRTVLDVLEQASNPNYNPNPDTVATCSATASEDHPNPNPNTNTTIFSCESSATGKQRESERERQRETERHRERHRMRQTETQRHRDTKRQNEVLHDKSGYQFTVIDNSGSMENEDGKQFYLNEKGIIIKYQYTSRWLEAVNKILQISEYNCNRGIVTSYYLLNPKRLNVWKKDIDYVVIDPSNDNCRENLEILKNNILSENNIRGATPLDKITVKFGEFLQSANFNNQTVCYNLVTDGEPNNKAAFEWQLRNLAKHNSVFIVVNLCTDEVSVIDYYNDLDVKIGNELSGMDVIDDFEAEQLEVVSKNDYFVYSFKIHIARMAGCYSVVADMMDEERLPLPYLNKLVKEILKISDRPLNITERQAYLDTIASENNRADRVYNYLTRQFEPPINMAKLTRLMMNKYSTANKCVIY